jgi:hypothetical protein
MLPRTGPPLPLHRPDAPQDGQAPVIVDAETPAARFSDVPADSLLTLRIVPRPGAGEYGLLLRADARAGTGYRLAFAPDEGRAALQAWPEGSGRPRAEASGVEGLDRAVEIVVCLKESVIDVCLNDRHTLIERCFDHRGTHLGLFARAGAVRVESLTVRPLL